MECERDRDGWVQVPVRGRFTWHKSGAGKTKGCGVDRGGGVPVHSGIKNERKDPDQLRIIKKVSPWLNNEFHYLFMTLFCGVVFPWQNVFPLTTWQIMPTGSIYNKPAYLFPLSPWNECVKQSIMGSASLIRVLICHYPMYAHNKQSVKDCEVDNLNEERIRRVQMTRVWWREETREEGKRK